MVDEPGQAVVQSSANAAGFLGLSEDPNGKALESLEGDLARGISRHLEGHLGAIPVAVRAHMGSRAAAFDCLVHRPPHGGLAIELERAGPSVDLTKQVEAALQSVVGSVTLQGLCDTAAALIKDLTGYDRVMVYRFDDEGHGEVYSEQKEAELEAYLGNRYPASDIPQIARRLYEKTRVRMLVDVAYKPVPIVPRLSPATGQDLDMSLCSLRSMSPIHIQYLKNMGVGATLVLSLVIAGKLWGLIACHHYRARLIHYELRTACELLAETIATRIAALESFAEGQAEVTVRRLEQRMADAISREGDWRSALFDHSRPLLRAVDAGGAALLFDGQVMTAGEVPGTQDLRKIGAWLDGLDRGTVFATSSLASEAPDLAALTPVASGVLAVAVSNMPGEYLIWFRPERVRTVTWGGNPFKPVEIGDDPSDLSPRRSFSQWHQLVEGTSEPWMPADHTAARLIGDSVTDVVLQFRSVRMLIAQNQLENISQAVRQSNQPIVIADAGGRILLTNEAFQRLLRASHPHVERLDDLPTLFAEPAAVRESIRALLETGRLWRAELQLETELGDLRPLLVRGDPVFSAPGRALGVVVLFTDLSERKVAERARRRFQEGIVELHRVGEIRLDSQSDLLYQSLMTSVIGNAQLTALEITDGLDLSRIPERLETVRTSVGRTAELLEHLIRHAKQASRKDS